ncbi:MAG: hypothetical protein AAFW74_12965, partial [Pseudomonadota bacterium]
RADRAKDLAKPPVHLLSCAGAQTHRQISMMPDLTEDAFLSADANEDGALSADEFASMKN